MKEREKGEGGQGRKREEEGRRERGSIPILGPTLH